MSLQQNLAPTTDELLTYRPFVARLARSLVMDPHEAADIEQQSWLRVLKRPPVHGTAVEAWLGRIVRNVARTNFETEATRRGHLLNYEPRRKYHSPPGVRIETAATEAALTEALYKLNPLYLEVFQLRYFENLSPPEVAKRLDVPLETVRTRLKRGRQQLRESLDSAHDGNRETWCLALVSFSSKRVRNTSVLGGTILLGFVSIVATIMIVVLSSSTTETIPEEPFDRETQVSFESRTAESIQTVPQLPARPTRQVIESKGSQLQVTLVDRVSGKPRSNVSVKLASLDTNQLFHAGKRSDSDGRIKFDGVSQGLWTLTPYRGTATHIWVENLDNQEVKILLDGLVTRKGRVVLPGGLPAVGAKIWTSRPGTSMDDACVGVSDLSGQFDITNLSPHAFIGARMIGFRRSNWIHTSNLSCNDQPTAISLREESGMRGIIRTTDGTPLENVCIEFSSEQKVMPFQSKLRRIAMRSSPIPRYSNANGHFTATDVPSRPLLITFSKAGFQSQQLQLNRFKNSSIYNGERPIDVYLARIKPLEHAVEASLTGTAYDSLGHPLAGARILALDSNRKRSPFSFLLFDSHTPREFFTDENGKVEIQLPIPPSSLDLFLLRPSGSSQAPLAYLTKYETSSGDWQLRATQSPSSETIGQLLNSLPGSAFVIIESDSLPNSLISPVDDLGFFRFEGLLLGNYTLSVLLDNVLTTDVYSFEVETVGPLTLEPIVVQPRGSAILRLVTSNGLPHKKSYLIQAFIDGRNYQVSPDSKNSRFTTLSDGVIEFENLKADTYTFTVQGEGFTNQSITLEVSPNRRNEVQVMLAKAFKQMVIVEGQGSVLEGHVFDENEQLVLKTTSQFLNGYARVFFRLPPGRYRLVLTVDEREILDDSIYIATDDPDPIYLTSTALSTKFSSLAAD